METDFAINSALTQRALTIAKALALKQKNKVILLGCGKIDEIERDGLNIFQIEKGSTLLGKVYYFIFRGFAAINFIRKYLKPDVIIFCGYSSRFLIPFLHYCKKEDIKLIGDIIEWYDYYHLLKAKQLFFALDVQWSMTRLLLRCNGIIAISSYLKDYFSGKGLNAIRVPVLIDNKIGQSEGTISGHFNNDKMNLIYAGIPGRKDLLKLIICSVEHLNEEQLPVCLHILGSSKEELRRLYKMNFTENIIFYGRIDQKLVRSFLEMSDFSVLIRPNRRYASAGFPTKFVESLDAGLPVIANHTSDLSYYLMDGYNGFVVPECTEQALTEKLKMILKTNKGDWRKMKVNASNTARQNFDFRLYSEMLNEFVSNLN